MSLAFEPLGKVAETPPSPPLVVGPKSDQSPSLTASDVSDRHFVDLVSDREVLGGKSGATNRPNVIWEEPLFGKMLPALLVAVNLVVGVGPQEQVIGSDAGRVVASVEYVHSVRDGAVGEFVTDPMGQFELSGAPAKATIPILQPVSVPRPTPVRLGHLAPESVFKAPDSSVVRIDAERFATSALNPALGRGRSSELQFPRHADSRSGLGRRHTEDRNSGGGR